MNESSSSDEQIAVERDVVAEDPVVIGNSSSGSPASASKGDLHSSSTSKTPTDGPQKKKLLLLLASIACFGIVVGLSLGLTSNQSSDKTDHPPSTEANKDDEGTSAAAAPWPHDFSDIAADPRVTYGVLDNGLRYAILPNSEPKDKLMLRMHVDAGSYQEEDDQQGLAHFLEHMAFNGLESFPDANDLIPQMQRLGIAFGAHANAYTSFDETVYMLDLPNATDESILDLGFTVLREYADAILFRSEEIEKERGVILAEKDARDSVSMRMWKKLYSFVLPDHRVSKRFPIGIKETISNVPRQRFIDFYDKYYSPDQITFFAVGDTDVATMKERIIEAYESMESRRSPQDLEGLDLGTVSTGTGFRTAVLTDKELVQDRLFINAIRPYEMKDDTEENRLAALPLGLANRILSQRIDIVAKKEGSPILSGYAERDDWFLKSGVEWGEIKVTPVSGSSAWKAAIPIIEQELRRVIEFGFAPYELEEQKANLVRSYQKAVDTASTRKSQALATELVKSVNGKNVVSAPEENLRIIEKGVETITVEQLHEAFVTFWDTPDLTLVLYTKEAEDGAEEEMKQIYSDSKLSPVSPPDMTFDATFGYTSFGPAGSIVSDTYVEDLDSRQLKLSNNVRVNLKSTDFEANTVRVVAHFGSGSLSQPPTKSGIQWLAPIVMNEGGLGKHSKTDLSRILAGNNVGSTASFSVGEGTFSLAGKTTPEDLELQLQLMTAYLSDPGYRSESEQYWQNIIPSYPSWFENTFDGVNYNVTTSFLRGHDGRFRIPSFEEMASLTADDVRMWLEPELSTSYLEVSVVGDYNDSIIPFLLNSFGALPEREDSPSIMPSEVTSLQYPPTPSEHVFKYESKLPHAAAMVIFKIPPLREDVKLTRRLNILSYILRDRMRKEIREEQGASYGPRTSVSASEAYDFGALVAYTQGSPENTAGMTTIIEALAQNMTTSIGEDELVRAKEPTMTSLKESLRSNTYWLNTVLSESQSKPWTLDWSRERDDDYRSISVEEIIELARTYFTKDNQMKVDIIPVTTDGE